jgi:hypothetical protein
MNSSCWPFSPPVHRLAEKVAPQRVSLVVVHHQGVHDELAGHSKGEFLSCDIPGIHDARIAERSLGHRNRHTSHYVVNNLVAA